MQALHYLKKIMILAFAALCVTIAGITNSNAATDTSSQYLAQIAKSTAAILTKVNDLPSYLSGLSKVIEMSISWLKTDDSDATANMQTQFATIGKTLGEANPSIAATNQQMLATLFNITTTGKTPTTFASYPEINTYTYSSFLGAPLAPKASDASSGYLKYIMNASGLSLPHQLPSDDWQGDPYSVQQYKKLYQVAMSAETFNSQILTELYYRNGKDLSTAQEALISKASSSDWIQEITTEELGKVMRQLLMFTAQQYVLTSELMKLQKETLTASVITNTLLILNNQKNEFDLLDKAKKAQ